MKHAKPNSAILQAHKLESLIHITLDEKGEPALPQTHITHTRIVRNNPALKPSIPNPITNHSISVIEELKSLPLATRLTLTGVALLTHQGYSLNRIIDLANQEGDFTTSSLLEHNAYLIQRLAHWQSDHLF